MSNRKSWLLHGPQGSGKTTIAEKLCAHLKLDQVIDIDAIVVQDLQETGVLYVTCQSPEDFAGSFFKRRVVDIQQARQWLGINDPNAVIATVDGPAMARASAFMAKQDVRYYLNGVHLRATGDAVTVEASDGHMAYAEECALGSTQHDIIVRCPPDMQRHLKSGTTVHVFGDGTVTVRKDVDFIYRSPGPAVIAGKFPDLTSVMPPADSLRHGLVGAFNPDYVRRVLNVKGATGCAFYHRDGMQNQEDPSHPLFAVLTGPGLGPAVALVMPLRVAPLMQSLPSYIPTSAKPKAIAA